MTYGSWYKIMTFKNGHIVKERALFSDEGSFKGVETRIFDENGNLLPLPNDRKSPADLE